MLLSPVSFMEI